MNKLYVHYFCDDDWGEGEVWFDDNKNPIGFYSADDANYRDEYQNFIFEFIGYEIIREDLEKEAIAYMEVYYR